MSRASIEEMTMFFLENFKGEKGTLPEITLAEAAGRVCLWTYSNVLGRSHCLCCHIYPNGYYTDGFYIKSQYRFSTPLER